MTPHLDLTPTAEPHILTLGHLEAVCTPLVAGVYDVAFRHIECGSLVGEALYGSLDAAEAALEDATDRLHQEWVAYGP